MLVWLKKWNIIKKVESYELKNIKLFERIYKNGRSYKIWWYWNPKQKFHQQEETISGKNVDITKIVVSSKAPFGKKGFT